MRTLLTAGLVAGAVLGCALAGSAGAADMEKHYQGVGYACTGIGEERNDPKWSTYPAKIVFTTKSGAYVADVRVTVADAHGKRVLDVTCDGPWLLARLAPGRYQVTAVVAGHRQKRIIVVPAKGQGRTVIRFPDIPS